MPKKSKSRKPNFLDDPALNREFASVLAKLKAEGARVQAQHDELARNPKGDEKFLQWFNSIPWARSY